MSPASRTTRTLRLIAGAMPRWVGRVGLLACVFWLGTGGALAEVAASAPIYELAVSFEPLRSRIEGRVAITLPSPRTLEIDGDGLKLRTLKVDGRPRSLPKSGLVKIAARKRVELSYTGTFAGLVDDGIHPGSIVLTENWFPALQGAALYRLRARLPKDYIAVSEAERIERIERGNDVEYVFDFPYPLYAADGLAFVASTGFSVSEWRRGNLTIELYLGPETATRSAAIEQRLAALFDGFEAQFGPYIYQRLAVVESPVTASLSTPTNLLMSRRALLESPREMPTLAHELAHQWFGNIAYIDFDSGNWAEGGANYFGDHAVEEARGDGWLCRKKMMIGYLDRVADKDEFPLTGFSVREGVLSRWIGYGKGAMVYHMLRKELGDEAFAAGVRDFFTRNRHRVASWRDWRESFEQAAGRDLGWFFAQWVDGIGLPAIDGTLRVAPLADGRFESTVILRQTGRPFRVRVPVELRFAAGSERHDITLDGSAGRVSFVTAMAPQTLAIDPDYDVLRMLSEAERYPTLAHLDAEERLRVIPPRGDDSIYRRLVDGWRDQGRLLRIAAPRQEFPREMRGPAERRGKSGGERRKAADQSRRLDQARDSVVILGRDNPAVERLLGADAAHRLSAAATGMSIEVVKHPLDPRRVVAIIDAADAEQLATGLDAAGNFAGFSRVVVVDGMVVEKSVAAHQQGLIVPAE